VVVVVLNKEVTVCGVDVSQSDTRNITLYSLHRTSQIASSYLEIFYYSSIIDSQKSRCRNVVLSVSTSTKPAELSITMVVLKNLLRYYI